MINSIKVENCDQPADSLTIWYVKELFLSAIEFKRD
jgi:hypothetical protein